MATTALQAETLRSAFNAFNHQSNLLAASYRELQDKVSDIARELAESETARQGELLEKERLGNRLAWILEMMPSAILVIDHDGFVVEHNAKAAELLDTPLLGCAWSVIVQREFCPDESGDGQLKLNDGRWLSLARRELDSGPGEILLLTDITESRERSEVFQRHQRLSCIGEMTARLGHQLRTPLASALLYVSQLEQSTGPEGQEIAAKITNRLQELAGMMDDMLRFAAGAKKTGERVSVADLLINVADTIAPQIADGAKLTIESVDPDLFVEVNRPALKGALLNLVGNALQACGDDPRIELGAVRANGQVCLTVTDNGQGIRPEIRRRVFDPFFTTRPQGTGLGLAVVRSVAEAHQGDVLVDSGPGGTTFAICLPVPEDEMTAEPETAAMGSSHV